MRIIKPSNEQNFQRKKNCYELVSTVEKRSTLELRETLKIFIFDVNVRISLTKVTHYLLKLETY